METQYGNKEWKHNKEWNRTCNKEWKQNMKKEEEQNMKTKSGNRT